MIRRFNPVLGLILGIAGGVFFSLSALLIVALRGPSMLDRLGVSLAGLLLVYIGGGAVGGTVAGMLLPLTRRRWGAALVGSVAALPIYHGAGMLLGETDYGVSILLAVLVGGTVGYTAWEPVATEGT
jgi:hypothetical protein